jgi:hypothetical protein
MDLLCHVCVKGAKPQAYDGPWMTDMLLCAWAAKLKSPAAFLIGTTTKNLAICKPPPTFLLLNRLHPYWSSQVEAAGRKG